MHGLTQQRSIIYVTAIAISIILSCWASLRGAVINPDAICYLQSAESMPLGLNVAAQLCDQAKWPFYSFLIFLVAHIIPLSYVHVAFFLDGLFSLISVVSFIAIVQFFKNIPRILWVAAAVILLAHEFNDVREYIIRDHGFWAFYLLSLLFFLHYSRDFRWIYALGWGVALVIATLFRIEGIIFLLVLPFLTLLDAKHSFFTRIFSFLKLNTITLIGLSGWCVWFVLHPQQNVEHLGRLGEIKFQFMNGWSVIANHFQNSSQILSQHVLSQYATHDAALVLFLMLTSWYFINVAGNLSFIYLILVIYAWARKLLPAEKSARLIIWSYVLLNVIITAGFLAQNMFLSKRYLLALSLTLLVWVPFALEKLFLYWPQRKWPIVAALALMMISSLGGIFDFGYSKMYIRDAGSWLATHVPAHAKLYSNDYQVMYYSQHFGSAIFAKAKDFTQQNVLADQKWKHYDYLALRLDKKAFATNEIALKKLGSPVQVFVNKRGDAVSIYKIH